jgi:SHAQKYF class myb-like DNA-binding protein
VAIVSFAQCNFLATISEAVPKRILELMNVPGLTRENVASHLQVCIFPYFSIFHNSLWFFPFFFLKKKLLFWGWSLWVVLMQALDLYPWCSKGCLVI